MIKTIKILMRITRKSDEDATTKRNPLRAMHLKKVKSLKTGLFTFILLQQRRSVPARHPVRWCCPDLR